MIDSSVFDWIEGLLAETDQRWTANQSEVPSIIYHYTSDKAFREIIQTATLRASDTSGLPDKDELTRAAELFRTIAQERALVAAERGRSDLYPARLLGLTYARPTLTRCFVTSMTTAEDDPAMWASYAADGSGVAIGFDSSQLMLLNESPSQHLGFFEVSYEDFQQQAFFEWLLHRWESQAMLPSTMNAGHGQEYLLSRFGVAIGCAAAVFPRMKNASFSRRRNGDWRTRTYLGIPDVAKFRQLTAGHMST